MKGITLLGYHSYRAFKLLLKSKEIGAAKVKTKKIDIEGADGFLDLTDFFGEPKYENTVHKFQFSTLVAPSEFLTLFSDIKNKIHGRSGRVALDDDPSYFYIGRCTVSSFTNEKNMGIVSVECDCEPWKYKTERTTVTVMVDGEDTIVLANSRKRAVPEVIIAAESALRITYQANIWDLGSGSYTLPELELQAGENIVSVTGTGTISFTWQEASQ